VSENTVTLTLKVDDKGTLSLVTKEAKKTSKAVEGVAKSTNKTTKSANRYNKAQKGVAGATSNSTKAFSKMNQGMGGSSGLVAAYATLAANIFAITAAFGALRRAAAVTQLEQGLNLVGAAAGSNLPYVSKQLQALSGYAISTAEAMRAVAVGASAGFSTAQLENLTKVAKGAAIALGRDTSDAIDRLIRGAAKLEPEILDELGIMVRLDSATEAYATTIGKTTNALTQFERRMAFTNAIIEQGEDKFFKIADAIDPNPYDRLAATFDDLSKAFFNLVNKTGLLAFVEMLSKSMGLLVGVIALTGGTVLKQMVPSLTAATKGMAELATTASAEASKSLEGMGASFKGWGLKTHQKGIEKFLGTMKTGNLTTAQSAAGMKLFTDAQKEASNRVSDAEVALTSKMNTERKSHLATSTGTEENLKYSRSVSGLKGSLTKAQAAERGVTTARLEAEAALKLTTASTIANTKAKGIANIQQGNLILGFKQTFAAIMQNNAALWSNRAATNVAATGWTILSTTVKVGAVAIGTAFLTMLPYIGLIVTAISLLWGLLSRIFGSGKMAKKVDEVSESFSSFSKINEQLKVVLDSNADATEKYLASLSSSLGIMDQLTAGIQALQATQSKAVNDDLQKQYTKLFELQSAQRDLIQRSKNASGLGPVLANNIELVKNLKAEIKGVHLKGLQLDEKNTTILMDRFLNQIEMTGTNIGPFAEQVENIKNNLNSPAYNTWDKVKTALEKIVAPGKAVEAAFKGIKSTMASISKEIIKLTGKSKGPLDGMIDQLTELTNSISLEGLDEDALALYLRNMLSNADSEFKAIYDSFDNITLGLSSHGTSAERWGAPLKRMLEAFVEANNILLTSKTNIESLKISTELLGDSVKSITSSLKDQLSIERQIINEKIKAIKATDFTRKDAALQEASRKKLNLLQQQYNDLSVTGNSITEGRIRLETVRAALSKKNLSQELKVLGAQTSGLKLAEDLWRANKKSDNLKAGGSGQISAKDEADYYEKNAKERVKILNKEAEIRFNMIEAETNLLIMKEQKLLATATNSGTVAEQTAITEYIESLKAYKGILKDNLNTQRELNQVESDVTGLENRYKNTEKTLRNNIVQVGYAKQLVDLSEKLLESKKQIFTNEQTALRQAKELAILNDFSRKEKGLNAKDELDLQQQAIAAKKAFISEEFNLKSQIISSEYTLIELKFQLLEAEAKAHKDVSLPDGFAKSYRAALEVGQTSAIAAAYSSSIVEKAALDLELRKAEYAASEAAKTAASTGSDTVDRLKNLKTAGSFDQITRTKTVQKPDDMGSMEDAEGNVDPNISEKIGAMADIVSPITESLRELGPNGELVSAVAEGALIIAEAFTGAFQTMGDSGVSFGERMAAGLQVGASAIGSIGSMMQANSKAQISEIDNQIDAEKKRDGKSKESLAKLAQLEKKKEKMQKKAFEQDKKMKMAQVVMATAAGVMQAFAQTGIFGFVTGALIAAMGVAQLAVIAGSSFQGGGASAAGGGASAVSMGDRSNSVDLAKGVNPAGEQAFMRGERGIGSGMTNFTPAFVGVKHRASGGATAGYMVGEQGPELFTPDRPGTIAPADESANRGSSTAVSFQINAIDSASVEDMLMSKRGVIIKNIRDAANQHGEFFLEQIREDSLT